MVPKISGFILVDKEVTYCPDVGTYENWWSDDENSRVARTSRDGVTVSTVFLGIDHNLFGAEPLFFETLVFNGEHDDYCRRYETWAEAEQGHAEVCKLVWPAN